MNKRVHDFANTPVAPGRPRRDYAPRQPSAFPAVSVITPYFNTGEVFLETAQCVMSQSLQQWEWLIVNDGSNEPDALDILSSFRDRDPRIRVIDMERNRGLPAARNAGLREAHAESVFFLDSDDLIEPTTLEKTVWCLESYPEFHFCKGFTVHFGAEESLARSGFEAGPVFLSRNVVTIRCLVRRDTARAVGGFDESLVQGLEDWDFWLKCAAHGYWGRTIPEFLDWYRRRESHSDRWAAWTPRGLVQMRRELQRRYPELYAGRFPATAPRAQTPYADIPQEIPFENLLTADCGTSARKRVLLIAPWMALGGSDKFNLDLIKQLGRHGYDVSMATTLPDNYPWYEEFARLTPDIFVLPNFLRPNDYPRFLTYLIRSRGFEAAIVSNSELAYRFLPLLRSQCPATTFVDFCHIEEENWNNGGHPRQAAAYQDALDLNIVSSHHLKEWMTGRGADPTQIEVCHTNADTELLSPSAELRAEVRAKMGLAADLPVILYAARLCKQKQPDVFARVVQLLHTKGLNFICLVAGDGEERKRLVSGLRRLRLTQHVVMLGAVSIEGMRELYAASDILFLPSEMEGIALTIFEAMAMGIVPVSADVGGQSELVTPECGILVKPSTKEQQAQDYAAALERLFGSRELRESMGRAARARVCSEFRLEGMGERFVQLLELAGQYRIERPKAGASPRLGTEHALQAVEHARVLEAANSLWKYHGLEVARRRVEIRLMPLSSAAWRVHGRLFRLWRLFRIAKDRVWIAGHWIKDRVWIAGHRIKVWVRGT